MAIDEQYELFSPESVREALKVLHDWENVGQQRLAQLEIVKLRRAAEGYESSSFGVGRALGVVLGEAIENLKPSGPEPRHFTERWGGYIILTEQHIKGRSRKVVLAEGRIPKGSYSRWQKSALQRLANELWDQESEVKPALGGVGSVAEHGGPFLAPPRPLLALVGRDQTLANLRERLLAVPSEGVLALNGLPGVGKTALSITLAHDQQVRAHFQDGVLWAGLGHEPDLLAIMSIWGIALRIPASEIAKLSTIEKRAARLRSAIGRRRMLLVIDDAWQIEHALAFKLGGPNCAYLLTTRSPEIAQQLAGEGVTTVQELNQADSLALLSDFVPQLVINERKEAHALVEAVGGLPLALTLIGNHLRKMSYFSPSHGLRSALEQLQQAEERLQVELDVSPLDLPPSLREGVPLSLLASIEISDHALPQAARQMLHGLALFPPKPNTFSKEAALAVADQPLKLLGLLTEAGLVENRVLGRYTMHQVIADYARFKNPDPEPYYRNGAAYFATFAQQQSGSDGYPLLDVELQNILTFLPCAYENQEWRILVDGVQGLTRYHLGVVGFMDARGHWNQATQLLEQALEGARSLHDPLLEASILTKLAAFAFRRADFERAKPHLDASHAILSRLAYSAEVLLQRAYMYEFMSRIRLRDNPQAALEWIEEAITELDAFPVESHAIQEQTGYLYVWSSTIFGRTGQLQKAVEMAQKGLSLLPSSANSAQIVAFIVLSNVSAFQGEIEKSIEYQKEGIQIAEQLGDLRRLATLWMNLANNQGQRQSNLFTALVSYQNALQLYQQMGDVRGESDVHNNLGLIYIMLGEDELALHYLTNAIQLAQTHGLLWQEAFASTNLANLLIYQAQLVEALALLSKADQIGQQLQLTGLLAVVWCWQAEIARINGEHHQALTLINASLEKAKKGGYSLEERIGWSIKGKILDGMRGFDEAEAAHQRSLRLLAKQQSPYDLAQSQLALGEHYLMRDEHLSDKAKSWLIEARTTFEGLGAKRELATIRSLLER
ncbi:MAG: NB-ARC domain-containing protein [Ardenticatenaceae bacterium]